MGRFSSPKLGVILAAAVLALCALAPPAFAQDDGDRGGVVLLGDQLLPADALSRLPAELVTGNPDRITGFNVPSIEHAGDSGNVRRNTPQDFQANPNSRDHFAYSWHVEGSGDHHVLGSATMRRFTFVPEDRGAYDVVLRMTRRDRPDHEVSEQQYRLNVSRPTRADSLGRSAVWGAVGAGLGALIGAMQDGCSGVDVGQGQACNEAWTGAAIGGAAGLGAAFLVLEW